MDSCSPEKRPPLTWAGVELSGRLPGRSDSLHVQTREQHMQRPKAEREILGLCGEIKSWGQAGLKRPCLRSGLDPVGTVGALCAGTRRSSSREFSRNPGIWLSRLLFGCGSSRAVLPQAVPRPAPGPGCQQDRAGRSALPETGRSRCGPGPGLGSPGDGSGRLGSVGRSERGLRVKARCAGGRRARSPAICHGELREGCVWGGPRREGRKRCRWCPCGQSLPLTPRHGRGARSVQGAFIEHSWV